ncbi:MAG TPA: hypothetical protein PKN80_02165, partial [bacterium]|nr:hypothetical protein [bacterium]
MQHGFVFYNSTTNGKPNYGGKPMNLRRLLSIAFLTLSLALSASPALATISGSSADYDSTNFDVLAGQRRAALSLSLTSDNDGDSFNNVTVHINNVSNLTAGEISKIAIYEDTNNNSFFDVLTDNLLLDTVPVIGTDQVLDFADISVSTWQGSVNNRNKTYFIVVDTSYSLDVLDSFSVYHAAIGSLGANTSSNLTCNFSFLAPNAPAQGVSNPNQVNEYFRIRWNNQTDTQINLYYVPSTAYVPNDPLSGATLIVSGLASTEVSYDWNTYSLHSGEYYIIATLGDGGGVGTASSVLASVRIAPRRFSGVVSDIAKDTVASGLFTEDGVFLLKLKTEVATDTLQTVQVRIVNVDNTIASNEIMTVSLHRDRYTGSYDNDKYDEGRDYWVPPTGTEVSAPVGTPVNININNYPTASKEGDVPQRLASGPLTSGWYYQNGTYYCDYLIVVRAAVNLDDGDKFEVELLGSTALIKDGAVEQPYSVNLSGTFISKEITCENLSDFYPNINYVNPARHFESDQNITLRWKNNTGLLVNLYYRNVDGFNRAAPLSGAVRFASDQGSGPYYWRCDGVPAGRYYIIIEFIPPSSGGLAPAPLVFPGTVEFVQPAVTAENLVSKDQGILSRSGPTAVFGLKIAAPPSGLTSPGFNKIQHLIRLTVKADLSSPDIDIRPYQVAIYKNDGEYLEAFDPGDEQVTILPFPDVVDEIVFELGETCPVPNDVPAHNEYFVVVYSRPEMRNNQQIKLILKEVVIGDVNPEYNPGMIDDDVYLYDPKYKPEDRKNAILGSPESESLTCEQRIVDLRPMRSDQWSHGVMKGGQPFYLNDYPSQNQSGANTYIYSPETFQWWHGDDHPAPFGPEERELMGMYDPIAVLGLDLAATGGFTDAVHGTEKLVKLAVIIHDGWPENFNPNEALATHFLSNWPNISLVRDEDGNGHFNPAIDTAQFYDPANKNITFSRVSSQGLWQASHTYTRGQIIQWRTPISGVTWTTGATYVLGARVVPTVPNG